MGVLDTLRASTPARESVTMCVDGALQAEWDRTQNELEDAGKADADAGSLALPALTEVVNRLDAIREKVAASQVTFDFEKIEWTERLTLQGAHAPRDGNLTDRISGFNAITYYPALIRASCVAVTGAGGDTVTEIPDEVWDGLLGRPATDDKPAVVGTLNSGQVDRLARAARKVNDGETTVPPSARSLLVSQDSGASLAQPSPGTSPRDGSEGGNRPGSPRSSTTKRARKKAGSAAS